MKSWAKRAEWLYAAGACSIVALMVWTLYDSFLPAQDGLFAYYGEQMKQGSVPYRDFFYLSQPFPLFVSQGLVTIGNGLMIFRYYGAIERIGIALACYWALRAYFSRWASFAGTTLSVVGMTTFVADVLHSYYYVTLLFSILATGFVARGLAAARSRDLWWGGFFLGMAFFSKQSLGGVMAIAMAACVALESGSVWGWWSRQVKLAAGFSAAGLPFMFWVLGKGLSGVYFQDVFFDAAGEKGGAREILFGFWSRVGSPGYLSIYLMVLLGMAGLMMLKRVRIVPMTRETAGVAADFWIAWILFAGAILVPFLCGVPVRWFPVAAAAFLAPRFLTDWTFYSLLLLGLSVVGTRWARKFAPLFGSAALLVLTAGSFAVMYAVGMSFDIQEEALCPGSAVGLAFVIDQVTWRGFISARVCAVVVAALTMMACVAKKDVLSYWWYGWGDTIEHEPGTMHIPKLAGFNIAPAEAVLYQKVYDLVRSRRAGSSVFSFPNCPLFNYIADAPQPTFAAIHYWDACPDEVARADAARLRENRPGAIVWLRAGETDVKYQEDSFREGRKGGYDAVEDCLRELTGSGDYVLAYRTQYNRHSFPIEVWLRR